MKLDHISPGSLKKEYNILCQRLLPKPEAESPFGASWCVVEPGGATIPHRHSEGETFILTEGAGELSLDGVTQHVSAGDVVFLPPNSCHQITNPFDVSLKFLSLWWETDPSKGQKTLIYAAPPTPNGDLHLGHLSGPYLASDIVRRALEASGTEVFLLCGTDDHQSYVATRAEQMRSDPLSVAAGFGDRIERALEGAGIHSDVFLRPARDPHYARAVQGFFDGLKQSGAVEYREMPVLVSGGRVYLEGMVAGECPNCGEETYGNLCEGCGLTVSPDALIQPTSLLGGEELTVERRRLPVLDLERFREPLTSYLRESVLPPSIRAYTERVLSERLPVLPLAYPMDWGLPFPGEENLKVHAWAEMAAAYLYGAECVGRPWTDCSVRKILAFGFDNSFYYLFHLPALWIARNPEMALPEEFLINHFLNLEGEKFSTSRQHAIWVRDALEEYPLSAIRFYLACRRPDRPGVDFRIQDFRRFWETQVREPLDRWQDLARTPRTSVLPPEGARTLQKYARRCEQLDWGGTPGEASRELVRLLHWGKQLADEDEIRSPLARQLLALWKRAARPILAPEIGARKTAQAEEASHVRL